MTHLYTIDNSKNTGYIRNYNSVKQNFCLVPHNDTSRPLIVPQENLIRLDDFLLPCNIPTPIVKPPAVVRQLVSSTLDGEDETYYTAHSKQSHSYNELLVKVISFMVQAENKTECTPPPI